MATEYDHDERGCALCAAGEVRLHNPEYRDEDNAPYDYPAYIAEVQARGRAWAKAGSAPHVHAPDWRGVYCDECGGSQAGHQHTTFTRLSTTSVPLPTYPTRGE